MSREYTTHAVRLPWRIRLEQRRSRLRVIWQLRALNPFKWRRRYNAMRDFSRKATRAVFFGEDQ